MKWLAILVIPIIMSGCQVEPPRDTLVRLHQGGSRLPAFTVTFSSDPAMLAGRDAHDHKACGQCGVVSDNDRFRTAWTLSFSEFVYGGHYDEDWGTFSGENTIERGESPYVSWRELCPVCYENYSDPVTHEYLLDGVRKTSFWGN